MVEPIDSNTPPTSEAAQLQFGLPMLFYIMTAYTIGSAFGSWSIVFTTVVLLFWWVLLQTHGFGTFVVVLVGLVAIISMSLPPMGHPIEVSRRISCEDNVRDLTLTLCDYEFSHGHFPAAYATEAEGKPKYSWRVLILPFIGEQNLYDQYNFDEPWDGPKNKKLLNQMPQIFGCPFHREHKDHTPYKLVVDQGTAFETGRTISYGNITDGSSNTICIVEDTCNPVPWTKPEDLTLEQAVAVLAPSDPRFVAHVYPSTFQTYFFNGSVSFMDGALRHVGPTIDPEVVRRLCLIADGEFIDHDEFGDSVIVVNRGKYVALAIYGCLLMLPGVLLLRQNGTSKACRNRRP